MIVHHSGNERFVDERRVVGQFTRFWRDPAAGNRDLDLGIGCRHIISELEPVRAARRFHVGKEQRNALGMIRKHVLRGIAMIGFHAPKIRVCQDAGKVNEDDRIVVDDKGITICGESQYFITACNTHSSPAMSK
ncbi:hypothetical protein [Sphingomonas yabuuchiae]|uniref:hypothetical protein n=1 Tax=Sphingomonas yabuuchiae TaxID=172044 RepID=UPI001ADF4735|nr:hypothetical protein [Sphingomonas yabuuchiae]